ncbi:MAG: endopeptidase La [Myxococcota bacterium]|jgi:ATP-dependent Lon protease|nr:endopeptidase La [Myxococcota bacterium]
MSGQEAKSPGASRFSLPILPLRNTVLFPQVVIPLAVGRPKSVRLIEEAVQNETPIAILTQKAGKIDDPSIDDLYDVGTSARIIKVVKIAADNYSVIIQGNERIRMLSFEGDAEVLRGEFEVLEDDAERDVELEALFRNLKNAAKQVVKFIPEMPKDASNMVDGVTDPSQLCDFVAANMEISIEEKQDVLSTVNLKERLKKVLTFLARQLEVLKVSDKIQSQIKEEIDKSQREYYLRQQLKAIREQLGELDGDGGEVDEIAEKVESLDLPDEVREACRKQVARLRLMQPASSEYGVTRTYVEVLLDIPWSTVTQDDLSVSNARRILDEDHYDLDRVKKRIVEYLAVRKLKADMKGPILCLVGPPGVGKTSLGKSVARALGRKFFRFSLGGMHDEAEIRGHRRTYVGALPGRIIQALRKVGTMNPVIMLDEIDKVGKDFRGDPSAALLEVLDPEQNHQFSDHYIELSVDLSKVLFIATANQLDTISAPLRDRMEVIEIPGYTHHDKLSIARAFLIPKQRDAHGITEKNIIFDEESVTSIISNHTREAGVRALEQRIADVCRGVAVTVADAQETDSETPIQVQISTENLDDFLGPHRFEFEVAERTAQPGVATGLAWTPAGGDILFIEVTGMPGKGELVITGKLGDVMQESIRAALSFIRSHCDDYALPPDFNKKMDVHLHVPSGAVPKDGPSAGITIFAALLSLFTNLKVRHDVAMTGEITLRGHILPVGGIKEKILAAHRAGIRRVCLPERNRRDLIEIKDDIKKEMQFFFVSNISELPDLIFVEPELLERRVEAARQRTTVSDESTATP